MKAFISYSHHDSAMLDILHKHLAQLKRENIITTWTDQEITAGNRLDLAISNALSSSNLFLALLSHEYIASRYCYETEFQKALEIEQEGKIIIVPIILDNCDWLNTPFKDFMALPKDGKAISTWENKNTAFLDVVQGLRRLIQYGKNFTKGSDAKQVAVPLSRNYRVKKDFDSIAKMEFAEASLKEVADVLKRYMPELEHLENIKTRILADDAKTFQCLLSNRNKTGAESKLIITINSEASSFNSFRSNENQLSYSIESNSRPTQKGYKLEWDDFHMFWSENRFYSGSTEKGLDTKSIADIIWNDWLESVGIS
jgi:hypothetical protein